MNRKAAALVTKNTLALLASRGSSLLFAFAFVVYVARYLGVAGFGKYAVVRSYLDLFVSLAATALAIVVTRDVARRPDFVNRYLSVSMVFVAGLAAVAGGLLVLLAYVVQYAPDTQRALTIAGLALLPSAMTQLLDGAFVGLGKAEYTMYAGLVENVTRIGASLLMLYLGYGLIALFVILVIVRFGMLLLYAVLLKRLVPDFGWDFDAAALKPLFNNWFVFAGENWLSNIFGSFDIILLSWLKGEAAVGLYAAAYKLLALGGAAAVSFTTAIFPYLSHLYTESQDAFRQFITQMLKFIAVLVLPVALLAAALADTLVRLLFSDAYAGAVPIFRILTGVLAVRFFLNLPLSYILFARGEQKRSLHVVALSFALYVPLGVWLTTRWAGVGAAVALLGSVTVAFGLYFTFVFGRRAAARHLAQVGKVALVGGLLGAGLVFIGQYLPILAIALAVVLYVPVLLRLDVISLPEIAQALGGARHVAEDSLKSLRRTLKPYGAK